jgi:hypothetical protein
MATIVLDEAAEAAGVAANSGETASAFLSTQMLGAVKGFAHKRPIRGAQAIEGTTALQGGTNELSAEEEVGKAITAEQSLRSAIRKSLADGGASVRKGLNPSFVAEYPLFGTNFGATDTRYAQLESQMAGLYAELGKNFVVAGPGGAAPSLVPYDLEAPSHLIYWFDTPIRAKLARLPGRGSAHKTKVLTGISGSQTSASAPIIDPTLSEVTSFSTWPAAAANLGVQGTAVGVDVSVGYKFLGVNENLSWLAQFSGVGFEDVTALANLIMMHEMYFAEEYLNIAGTATALQAPATVAVTARTAGSGETAFASAISVTAYVTACNYYGETAATKSASPVAISTTQVADVVITPGTSGAGQQFKVYVTNGTTDPGRTSAFFNAQLGGTKFTVQGTIPSAGAVPPAADSGTSATTRYEGLLSVISGHAAAAGVYPAGFQGSYINMNVQAQLGLTALNAALAGMWDSSAGIGFRANPEELLVEGRDSANLSADVAKNSSGTNYQLLIQQGDMAGVLHGTAVSQVVNPITRRIVNITVHPGFLQGTAILTQWSTPNAARNANVFEMRVVQDLLSVSWPVIDPTYRFSMFEYGTFFAQAPQFAGVLGGLQVNAAGPWS